MADDFRASIDIETSNAESNVEGLEGKVKNLDAAVDNVDGQTVSVPVDAPGATETTTQLDGIDAAARRAQGGAKVGSQAISDLTGPLGNASGAASTMGQSVEGLAGLLGPMAEKAGLSEEAIGSLTSGLGVAAVVVAAGAALWSVFKDNQAKAREETKKMIEVEKDFKDGKFEDAAQKLIDKYGELFDQAKDAGVGADTLTKALLGNNDAAAALNATLTNGDLSPADAFVLRDAIDSAAGAFQRANDQMLTADQRSGDVAAAMEEIAKQAAPAGTTVGDLADQFDHLNDALDLRDSVLDVADAFDDVRDKADAAKDAVKTGGKESEQAQRDVQRSLDALEQKVLKYAGAVKDLPADKVTAIIADIDDGKLAEAQAAFDALAAPVTKTIIVTYHEDDSRESHRAATAGAGPVSDGGTTINVYQPPITPLAVSAAQQRTDQIQRGSNYT